MHRQSSLGLWIVGAVAVVALTQRAGFGDQAASAPVPGAVTPRAELYTLENALLRWPLPPGEQRYAAIDGKRMHRNVVEQAAISRRYRDQGHPKFWGRITGTSSDAESADWLAGKFKAAGLTDVRIQPLDLEPQWMPQQCEVVVSGGGKTIRVESAQPHYGAAGLPAGGIDVEAVYAGLGSEADFAGKDVRGKAVFVFNQTGLRMKARCAGPMTRARRSFSRWTCCQATCAIRPIRQAPRRPPSRSEATRATPCGT